MNILTSNELRSNLKDWSSKMPNFSYCRPLCLMQKRKIRTIDDEMADIDKIIAGFSEDREIETPF